MICMARAHCSSVASMLPRMDLNSSSSLGSFIERMAWVTMQVHLPLRMSFPTDLPVFAGSPAMPR